MRLTTFLLVPVICVSAGFISSKFLSSDLPLLLDAQPVLAAPKAPAGNKATDEFDKIAANKSKAVDDKIKALDNVGEIDAAAARGLAATFLKIESWVDHGRLANAIIDTLEAVTNADALKEFRQEMQRGADLHVRLRIAYFNAVANNDQSDDREAFLTGLTASSITSLRVLAVRACGENRFKSGFDKVKNSLNNESWRVQLSAIEALVNYAADPEYTDAAIEAIINFMGRIDGKLVEDCAKALRDITGEDYGTDAEAWRAWFRQKQGNPDKGGAAPSGDSHKKRYRTATFDVDTFSKQLIFVIDASSSMREPVDPDAVEETKKRVITGKKNGDGKDGDKKKADKKEDDIDWSNVKTKLDLAKIELIRTVQALSEDSMFNIVSFSTTVFKPWKPTLTQATQANKEDAAKYIKGLATGDETNIFDSIYTAMEMAEKGYDDAADPKKKGPVTGKKEVTACDTIYFITDGYATAGKYQGPKLTGPATDEQKKYYGGEMDAMIKELAHRNQVAKITLHTVGVGPGHDTRTLPNLAKAMGGNYKAIGMGLAKK